MEVSRFSRQRERSILGQDGVVPLAPHGGRTHGKGAVGGSGVWSYPSQGLLHRDHLLLHHHHQLDALFIAHGDLAGHVANVFPWQIEEQEVRDQRSS